MQVPKNISPIFRSIPFLLFYREECRLGIYVLWIIEAIRLAPNKSEDGSMPYASLNPLLIKKEDADSAQFQPLDTDDETSHSQVAQAYRDWWKIMKTCCFSVQNVDPLEGSIYQWHWHEIRERIPAVAGKFYPASPRELERKWNNFSPGPDPKSMKTSGPLSVLMPGMYFRVRWLPRHSIRWTEEKIWKNIYYRILPPRNAKMSGCFTLRAIFDAIRHSQNRCWLMQKPCFSPSRTV